MARNCAYSPLTGTQNPFKLVGQRLPSDSPADPLPVGVTGTPKSKSTSSSASTGLAGSTQFTPVAAIPPPAEINRSFVADTRVPLTSPPVTVVAAPIPKLAPRAPGKFTVSEIFGSRTHLISRSYYSHISHRTAALGEPIRPPGRTGGLDRAQKRICNPRRKTPQRRAKDTGSGDLDAPPTNENENKGTYM